MGVSAVPRLVLEVAASAAAWAASAGVLVGWAAAAWAVAWAGSAAVLVGWAAALPVWVARPAEPPAARPVPAGRTVFSWCRVRSSVWDTSVVVVAEALGGVDWAAGSAEASVAVWVAGAWVV